MKKNRALFAALMLLAFLAAVPALAAGNATVAVYGRNGFDDHIQNLFVIDGELFLSGDDALYSWTEETGLIQNARYQRLYEIVRQEDGEDGERLVRLGEETWTLEADESLSFYGDVFAFGDRVFGMLGIYDEDGCETALLVEIVPDGVGAVIDATDALVIDNGDYAWIGNMLSPCAAGGVFYALCEREDGLYALCSIDPVRGGVDELPVEADGMLTSVAQFDGGRLLLTESDDSAGWMSRVLLYDVEEEETVELGPLPIPDGAGVPAGLCFDTARSRLYYAFSGALWRVEVAEDGLGEPEMFADMPLDSFSYLNTAMLGDRLVIAAYDSVIARDVTVEHMPERKLHVVNAEQLDVIESAYFDFTDAHPDFSVSLQNGVDSSALLTAMLTRSSDADVIVLPLADPACAALLSRGYAAPLEGNADLRAYVESLYPFLRDAVSRDGEILAVPLNTMGESVYLNKGLLETLGFAELPANWVDLLGMIAALSDGRMDSMPEATLLGPGYSQSSAKEELFAMMFNDYMLWLDGDEARMERAADVLRTLCAAFERIDWDGFGLPEEIEDAVWPYEPEKVILEYNTVSPHDYGEDPMVCAPMAVVEGEAPLIPMDVTVALVNPFSENVEAAEAYIAAAARLVTGENRIRMVPSENEPVEWPFFQDQVEWYEEHIAEAEEKWAEAEEDGDGERITYWENETKQLRENLTRYAEEERYSATPESIAAYRALDGTFAAVRSVAWRDDTSRIGAYLDGAISAEQLVSWVETQVLMRRMEQMD